jgi:hypothetical protein
MVCSLSFRRQARVCACLAEECDDQHLAERLKAMASDLLAEAEILEELPGERASLRTTAALMRLADKRARDTLIARAAAKAARPRYIRSLARRAPTHRRYFYYPRAGRHLGGALRDEDYLAGKSIACCYVPSTFLAIGRCARPCERA